MTMRNEKLREAIFSNQGTWCVCGRRDDEEAWEQCQVDLADEASAVAWLRENYLDMAEMEVFYLQSELDDNPAEIFAHVRDGVLCFENASGNPIEV